MSFAPDYGYWLMNNSAAPDVEINFANFYLDHISAVEPGSFTAAINIAVDDVPHALSIDFDTSILQDIVNLCPDEIGELIVEWVSNSPDLGTLELPEPVFFGVIAKLGQPQTNNQEMFVPLVVQKVFSNAD